MKPDFSIRLRGEAFYDGNTYSNILTLQSRKLGISDSSEGPNGRNDIKQIHCEKKEKSNCLSLLLTIHPSIQSSILPSIQPYNRLFIHPSIQKSIHLIIHLSSQPASQSSIFLCIHPSIQSSILPPIHPYNHLFIQLSIYIYVHECSVDP